MHSHKAVQRRFRERGFTVVELVIVIVVIAILATIVIVSYTGIRERAINTSRKVELVAWRDAFILYKSQERRWPPSMVQDDEYCLGEGYPIGAGGVARCHNYQSTGTAQSPGYAVLQSANAALMADLGGPGAIPKTGDRTPVGGIVGPYVRLKSNGPDLYIRLTMTQLGVTCPEGTELYWADAPNNRSTCIIEIY